MAKKKKQAPENTITFEESFNELQQIVSQLEEGQLPLSESLAQYEKGIKRLRECYQALDNAEQKIKMLVDLDEDGNLITTDFKSDSANSNEESSGRRKKVANDNDSEGGIVDDDRALF